MSYPSEYNCQCDHKGSKFIVPLHLLNLDGNVTKPKTGFIKLYFKDNILHSKDEYNVEKNLVLDTKLDGLTIGNTVNNILPTDTIIIALGKLQTSISLSSSTQSDWEETNSSSPSYILNKPKRFIRKSETFYAPTFISYLAYAPMGSLETDNVWTITKRVGSADGTIISITQFTEVAWTNRINL